MPLIGREKWPFDWYSWIPKTISWTAKYFSTLICDSTLGKFNSHVHQSSSYDPIHPACSTPPRPTCKAEQELCIAFPSCPLSDMQGLLPVKQWLKIFLSFSRFSSFIPFSVSFMDKYIALHRDENRQVSGSVSSQGVHLGEADHKHKLLPSPGAPALTSPLDHK